MKTPLIHLIVAALAGALGGYGLSQFGPPAAPLIKPIGPDPKCPDCKPKSPKRPWGDLSGPAVAGQAGEVEAGEVEPAVDLLAMPKQLRRPNIRSQGLGCCTFRSAEYAAYWQNIPVLYGLPEWMAEQGIPGGGDPSKQAEIVKAIAQARGMEAPRFVQYEGSDLGFIELVLKTGRVASVTWNGNHMLSCVHLDSERAAIVDNNQPDRVQWFSRAEFARRHTNGGAGWVFVLVAPPPPPPPSNAKRQAHKEPCPCSPRCTCGCNEGKPCTCATRPDAPGGMTWVPGKSERYSIDGAASTRPLVEALFEDDSEKLRLTVIGTPAECKVALGAIGPLADRHLVQAYEPGDWALGCGFSYSAGPTVYLQTRDGRVLLHTSGVAGLFQKLRRADPTYRPEDDPTGDGLSLPDGARKAAPFAGGGGLLLLLWLLARKSGGAIEPTVPAPQAAQSQPLSPLDLAALDIGRRALTRSAEQLAGPRA